MWTAATAARPSAATAGNWIRPHAFRDRLSEWLSVSLPLSLSLSLSLSLFSTLSDLADTQLFRARQSAREQRGIIATLRDAVCNNQICVTCLSQSYGLSPTEYLL